MRSLLGLVEAGNETHQASPTSLFAFTKKKHLTALLPALLLTILAGALKPVITIFLGRIFDELSTFGAGEITGNELLHSVSLWCIALTGLGVATMVVNGGFFSLWLVFGEMQAGSVRNKAFISMLEKEIEWYDLRADGIGSLLVRIQTQIRELQMSTSQPLGFFIEDTAAALAALGIAFYYSWNLSLVILAFVPTTVMILAITSRKLQPAIETQKRDLSEASKHSHTAITAVDTVKIFNGQEQEVWQYSRAIKKAAVSYMIQANANSLQMGITRFMTTGMFVVGFWYGRVLARRGLPPGNVLTTFYACLMATEAAEALLPQWLVLTKGMSAGETLRYMFLDMGRGRRVSNMIGTFKPKTCQGDVEVSNLSFSYPSSPDQLAIENASFFFPAGETSFVIGRSGSGKSTLGNLLMRFYQPSSGTLRVDGRSLQTLDLGWLRDNIGLVQQESVLFNETMFQNIALGRRPHTLATKDDVRMACQTALLQQTVNDLQEGLDAVVGLGGNSLSGGQKQRIAIARARLHDPPILILDESTSALDQMSRSLVMEAIRKWRRGKTTIIITHDMSEVLEKDYVYVLDRGRVVQEGYRSQLLQEPAGLFTSLISFKDKDEKAPISERVALPLPEPRRSIATSFEMNGSEDAWPQTHIVLEPARSRSLSMPFRTLAIPHLREIRQSYNSNYSSSVIDLESLENGAKSRKISRSQIPRSQRSSRIYSNNHVNINRNTFSYISPHQISERVPERAKIPARSQHKSATLSQILGTVWPNLVRQDRVTLILGFLTALISSAATPAFSYVLARLLGSFSLTSDQASSAEVWALAILAIAMADGISSYYMHYFFEYCGQAWVDRLRVKALKRILAQPKAWFDNPKNNPGRLNECLDRNAEEMRNLMGRFVGYAFLAGSMMTIAIVWAFIVCWKLTLVGLTAGPCMYAFTRAFEVVSGRWEGRLNVMADTTANVFTETFSNIKVVRALSLEKYFDEKHTRATVDTYNVGIRRAAYTGLFFGVSDSINNLVTALILYYGAIIAASGAWNVGSILQVITLLLFSSGNANSAIALIPQISSSRTTATQILQLSNLPPSASHESRESKNSPRTLLPIRLNSLSFAYPSRPSPPILHNVNITFPPGSCTAIVGPSGSGKSTLASLLAGLYPPTESLHCLSPSLTFSPSRVSIFSLNTAFLRTSITLVAQSPVIFPTTILENIAYGLPGYSPLRSDFNIRLAAQEAGIHDRIMEMERGYETRIGDGGVGLSGGEKQRVALARGLARRAKCLVLDEPSSGLDGESAAVIRKTIRKLTTATAEPSANRDATQDESDTGKQAAPRTPSSSTPSLRASPYSPISTAPSPPSCFRSHAGGAGGSPDTAVILITHSPEMMRVASNIIVLDEGRVVQEGSFEELARKRGPFQRLILAGRRGGGYGDGDGNGNEGNGEGSAF